MINKQSGNYYIEVLSGESEGKTYNVRDEDIVIGSSSDSVVVLNDSGVMSEHLVVSQSNKRIMVENRSSSGIVVDGKFINGKVFLKVGSTITVGDNINIRLCSTLVKINSRLVNILFPLIIVLIVFGGFIVTLKSMNSVSISEKVITSYEWSLAYSRIYKRLYRWEENMQIPDYIVKKFTNAWIRDQSGDKVNALRLWIELYNIMTVVQVQGVTSGKVISESVDSDKTMLYAMMDRVSMLDPNESLSLADSDKAYLSALWCFVGERININKPKK